MKFLFIVKQKKNVDTFQDVIERLLAGGHAVTLAIQDRSNERDRVLLERFSTSGFEVVGCPDDRGDAWRMSAPLLRAFHDWAQYLREPYRHASKLRQRAAERLTRELGAKQPLDGGSIPLGSTRAAQVHEALRQFEASIPSDPLHTEFIARHRPDVVLVTPGLHFGSAQADFIKSSQALGVPVWMLLFSWDNLSTKGALHVFPDLMFVWNERQRQEAVELHGYPSDRVVVTGAPRFDEFFALRNVLRREEFFAPLDLEAARPTLLYLCSSRFIAEKELSFIRTWLAVLRSSRHEALHDCNVIVRPHPDITLVDDGEPPCEVTWPALPRATGWIQRPFEDSRTIVLRTSYRTQQAFYECLFHSAAAVGLNTSAELEAGIAGRPVLTVDADQEGADGQASTLHFNYLLRDHGGFVVRAANLAVHADQLNEALTRPVDDESIRSFIMQFLRPHGDQSVSALLAERLVTSGAPIVSPRHASTVRLAPADEGTPTKTLPLGAPGAAAKVFATPETKRSRTHGVFDLDPATMEWLENQVRPGDVMYDIGAGVGAYSVVAATQRGAISVAFEPGFATFKRLCENVMLNGCSGGVIPLPVALGDRTGLHELAYAGQAGGDLHAVRQRNWRTRRETIQETYAQPVCVDTLMNVVRRFRLPHPNAIRIAGRGGAAAILAGAGPLLRRSQLTSILVSVAGDDEDHAVTRTLQPYGFLVVSTVHIDDKHRRICLQRTAAPRFSRRGRDLLERLARRTR